MQFTNEQINKAKQAKSVEELLAIAKANGIELTEEQAKAYYAELHKTGELTDEELTAVTGGSKSKDNGPKYYKGELLYFETNADPYMIVAIGSTTANGKEYTYTLKLVSTDKYEFKDVTEVELDSYFHR